MATNDMQTFLPLLQQPQVPVTPQAAPVPQPSADATLRRRPPRRPRFEPTQTR